MIQNAFVIGLRTLRLALKYSHALRISYTVISKGLRFFLKYSNRYLSLTMVAWRINCIHFLSPYVTLWARKHEITKSRSNSFYYMYFIFLFWFLFSFFNNSDPDFLVPIFTRYCQLSSIPSLSLLSFVTFITILLNKLLYANYYQNTVLGLWFRDIR